MRGVGGWGGGRGSEIHIEGDRTWCGACLSRLLDFSFGGGLNTCVCCFQIKTSKMSWKWSHISLASFGVPHQQADEDENDEKVDAKIEAKRLRKSERKEQKRLHAKEQRCEGFT